MNFSKKVYGVILKAAIRKPDRSALLKFSYGTKIINQKGAIWDEKFLCVSSKLS